MGTELARHVDQKGLRFLRAVEYYGGEATMTEIRERTGLSRDAANHRFRRLDELDLIDISYADDGYGDRTPPKVARLTGTGRREIERGLFAPLRQSPSDEGDAVDLEAEIQALEEEVDRLERRLDTIASHSEEENIEDRVNDLEQQLHSLEEYVDEWHEAAEDYLRAFWFVFEDQNIDPDEYL